MIIAKQVQYVTAVYTPCSSTIWTEKYPVIKLTGKNRMVTLAKRIVIRVRLSTAEDSLIAMRLKFCITDQCTAHMLYTVASYEENQSILFVNAILDLIQTI